MSQTLDIVCIDCQKGLWIGQEDFIYLNDEIIMTDFKNFLFLHKSHSLRFLSDADAFEIYYSSNEVSLTIDDGLKGDIIGEKLLKKDKKLDDKWREKI